MCKVASNLWTPEVWRVLARCLGSTCVLTKAGSSCIQWLKNHLLILSSLLAFALLPSGGGTAGGSEIDFIPSPTRTINVSNSSRLSSALSSARPGDHIVLANGSYSGFTISRSGQSGKPIVVRAASTLGAKVGGKITIRGNDVYVVGVDLTSGNVLITGTRDRISSSRLRASGSAIHFESSARGGIADHNEIISQATPTSIGWNGIRVDVISPNLGHRIYRNYLHDAPRITSGDDNSAVQLGYGKSRDIMGNVLVEYNLLYNWYGDGETISCKTSGHTIRFNTVINATELVNRIGHDNTWAANWFENAQGIRINDRDNIVLGNRGAIRVLAGNWNSRQTGYYQGYGNALNTIVAGNEGALRVGYEWSGGLPIPAKNTRVEAHSGSITRGNEVGTTISESTSRTVPKAFKLTPSQVGPFAPTAPKVGHVPGGGVGAMGNWPVEATATSLA